MPKNETDDFNSPEFLESLKKYEDMKKGIVSSCYLDIDTILDISEYYEVNMNSKAAGEVLAFGIQLHPDDIEIKKFKIQNLIIQNQLKEAENVLNDIKSENSDPEIQLMWAALYLQKGERIKGLSLIEKVLNSLTNDDDLEMCVEQAGNMLLGIQDAYRAYNILEKYYPKFPDNKVIRELYAEACYDKGNFYRAAQLYNKSLDEDPYDVDKWIFLARSYIFAEDYKKAHESLDFAAAIDENVLEIDVTRASCYYQQRIFDKALEYYKKVYEKDPTNELAIMYASACCLNIDKEAESANLIEQAIRVGGNMSPQFIDMRLQAAIIFEHMNNYAKALFYLNEALENDETVSQAYILRGRIYLKTGKLIEAEKELNMALKYADKKDEYYFNIALAYYDAHLFPDAIGYFRLLPKGDFQDSSYAYMADCYLQSGQSEKYFSYLQLACRTNPESVKNVFGGFIPEGIAPDKFYEYVRQNWNGYNNNLFK